MHNFALRSSLAAKSEIVRTLRGDIRDFFGRIHEYKSKFNERTVRKLIRNTFRLKKSHSGVELAELLWPGIQNFLELDIDFNQEYSEFEKKAFIIVVLERANKFFNFEFLPRDTLFQVFLFYSLLLPYISSVIFKFYGEEVEELDSLNKFMATRLNYSINISLFQLLDPDLNQNTVQDFKEDLSELKVFFSIKKLKIDDKSIDTLALLFNEAKNDLTAKLDNYLYKVNDLSFLKSSENLSGISILNSCFYNYMNKNLNLSSYEVFRSLVLSYESSLFLVQEMNDNIDKLNDQILDYKYDIKEQILNLSSDKLYDLFFSSGDFIAKLLRETVIEFSDEAGHDFENLQNSLLESKSKSQDFYTAINSILICSCSYFDCEQLKVSFFNKVCDYIRVNLKELDLIDTEESQIIALAALSSSKDGINLLLSIINDDDLKNNFAQNINFEELLDSSINSKSQSQSEIKAVDYFKHNIQFQLWKKAKSVLNRYHQANSSVSELDKALV